MRRFIAFLLMFLLIGCAQEVKLPSIGGHITESNIDQIVMTGSGEGVTALLLNPSSNNVCYTTSLNNSDCFDEIAEMQRENGNVTRFFGGIASTPWMDSSTACGVSNIKSGASCNIGTVSFSEYCQVSDEHSVQAMTASVGNNVTIWDGFYNFLNNSQSFSAFGRIPGWKCLMNETAGTWDCRRANVNGNGDTASDATARYIIATYAASVNPLFPTANQTLYRALGDALVADFVRYDLRYQCTNSTLGNGPICWWQASGGNSSTGGFSWGDFYYSGYNQDSILALYAAANSTGNMTYIAIAQNLTQGYLQLSNWTGTSFRVPPGRSGNIDLMTVGGQANVPVADCDNTCNPDVWDTADAPRAHGWGIAQFVATNLTGIPLLNMTTYLTQWNIAVLSNNNNSIPISFHSNGTTSGSNQSGYLAQGWQSEALAYANQTKFPESLKNALAHISPSTRTPDSAACFGTYNEGPMMRSLAFGLGRFNAMYTRSSSSSSNGSTSYTGAINITVNSPTNASTSTVNTTTFNVTVWNLNNSDIGGAAGWGVVYDINMTTNPCTNGWTCGTGWAWDSASGKLFYNGTGNTGNLHSGDLTLSSYSAYNVSVNISTQNTTNTKLHYMTDNGELDNCKFAPRRTSDTQHDVQRDCGSFSNTAAWNNGVEARIDIFVNVTGNVTIACRTASGTTSCTSSAGAELTDLGDYFGIDDPQTCVGCTGSWLNITRFTVTAYTSGSVAGNSTMNVSFVWVNGTTIYQQNGTENATNVVYTLPYQGNGNYTWYVLARSKDNVVNYSGLTYSTVVTPPLVDGAALCVNISEPLWNANISRGRHDPKTRTYNESFILPVNNSMCGYTYSLTNSGGSPVVFIFTTNYTNPSGNLTMFVNGTMINASASTGFTVPAGQTYYVNVSINLTRWPVLQSEPSVTLGVGV